MTACIRIYYVIVIATGLYGIITDFTDFQRIHFSLDALKGGLVNFSPFQRAGIQAIGLSSCITVLMG